MINVASFAKNTLNTCIILLCSHDVHGNSIHLDLNLSVLFGFVFTCLATGVLEICGQRSQSQESLSTMWRPATSCCNQLSIPTSCNPFCPLKHSPNIRSHDAAISSQLRKAHKLIDLKLFLHHLTSFKSFGNDHPNIFQQLPISSPLNWMKISISSSPRLARTVTVTATATATTARVPASGPRQQAPPLPRPPRPLRSLWPPRSRPRCLGAFRPRCSGNPPGSPTKAGKMGSQI